MTKLLFLEPEIITTIENNETCGDNIAETDPYNEETNSVGKNEEVFFCDITESSDYENDKGMIFRLFRICLFYHLYSQDLTT